MFVWDLFQMAFYLHWIRIHFMVWTGQSVSCVVCARQKQQHTLCRQQFNNININDMYIYSFRTCVLFSTVLALPEAIQSCTKQCKHTKFVDLHEFWFMFFFFCFRYCCWCFVHKYVECNETSSICVSCKYRLFGRKGLQFIGKSICPTQKFFLHSHSAMWMWTWIWSKTW